MATTSENKPRPWPTMYQGYEPTTCRLCGDPLTDRSREVHGECADADAEIRERWDDRDDESAFAWVGEWNEPDSGAYEHGVGADCDASLGLSPRGLP